MSEQLREWSTLLAQSVEPADLDDIKTAPTSRTGTGTHRLLAVAASVVVVVAGVVAIASLGADDLDPVTPASNPPASTAVTEQTSTPNTTVQVSPGQPTVISGTGDVLVEFDRAVVGPQIVAATNSGPGNFRVHTRNAAQEEDALVVDVVGATTGRYFTGNEFQFLRIESQGDWTIEMAPADLADIPLWAEGTYTGAGNDVVRYTGEPGLLSYSNTDDPSIAVRSHGSDSGAMFVAVIAEGAWTLTIEPVP